jgi:tRNA(Ile)-lysidine synthase TilS/MesJ
MRKHFYEQKHLLNYNRPILNIWTPEINYYVADKQFALFTDDCTGEMNISLIYENNNTINNLFNEEIRSFDGELFNITNQFVSVVILNSRIYISSHDSEREIRDTFNEKYREFVDAQYCYGKLGIIDLSKTKICWSHKSEGAITDYYVNYIQWDSKRNEIMFTAY